MLQHSDSTQEEEISASIAVVWRFLLQYEHTGTTARQSGRGAAAKIDAEVKAIVEPEMR